LAILVIAAEAIALIPGMAFFKAKMRPFLN
jgi:hypothetical protein